jgi:lipopolysaccharide biosynthesis protein
MISQQQIDRELSKIKSWYIANWPLCIFCGHRVKEGTGDIAHLIRRSYSRDLQTVKLNTGLAHRECHYIFDNEPDQAIYLPRIIEILYIVYLLDENYFNLIAGHYEQLADVLQLFPSVPYQKIEHHGELLTLQYLYS